MEARRLYGGNVYNASITLLDDEVMMMNCVHCWHQWGTASGGVGSDGSYSSSGMLRCCHCGAVQHYAFSGTARPPEKHGRFFAEIQLNRP